MRLRVTNYRGLHRIDWAPEGACVLVGPNGSGKSTLLDVLRLLRYGFLRSISEAIRLTGGPEGLRHQDGDTAPMIEIEAGDARWKLVLPADGSLLHPAAGEEVQVGDRTLIRREMYSPSFVLGDRERTADERTGLRLLADSEPPPGLSPLSDLLQNLRCHRFYAIQPVRKEGSASSDDLYLRWDGGNVLSVLKNWNSSRRYRDQYNALLSALRRIFPPMFADMDFSPDAPRVWARFFRPGKEEGLPIQVASDGLVASMMALTAVIGAKDGSLIMIDEIEDALHPGAIRALVGFIRAYAEEHRLTVILTTHSAAVIDLFDDTPEQVYVMEEGQATLPVAITALHDRDWLAHFRLGQLYGKEYGIQRSEGREE